MLGRGRFAFAVDEDGDPESACSREVIRGECISSLGFREGEEGTEGGLLVSLRAKWWTEGAGIRNCRADCGAGMGLKGDKVSPHFTLR